MALHAKMHAKLYAISMMALVASWQFVLTVLDQRDMERKARSLLLDR
jgi:hypothetical protein